MKRIAVLFEYSTLNGGERSMLAVFDRLADRAFEFVALAPEAGCLAAALKRRGIRQIAMVLRDATGCRLPGAKACEIVQASVGEARADLVHANSLSMGRLLGAVSGSLPMPCSSHLRDIVKLSRAAVADLNRNGLLVPVSVATQDFHVRQGLESRRMQVVYNGVDCDRFCPRPATGWLKRELSLPGHAVLIGTIGQISLRKAQDVLAAAAVLAAPALDHAHYVLIGERHSTKPESVAFERAIVETFEQAGLGDRLHRLGNRSDVDRIMNELDLLVHPAKQEPLGRVLLEAAASGLPIVATDVGGTREIVEDGRSARLVPPNDPQQLADAIVELSRSDVRGPFARRARRAAKDRFSIERAATEHQLMWNLLPPK